PIAPRTSESLREQPPGRPGSGWQPGGDPAPADAGRRPRWRGENESDSIRPTRRIFQQKSNPGSKGSGARLPSVPTSATQKHPPAPASERRDLPAVREAWFLGESGAARRQRTRETRTEEVPEQA